MVHLINIMGTSVRYLYWIWKIWLGLHLYVHTVIISTMKVSK